MTSNVSPSTGLPLGRRSVLAVIVILLAFLSPTVLAINGNVVDICYLYFPVSVSTGSAFHYNYALKDYWPSQRSFNITANFRVIHRNRNSGLRDFAKSTISDTTGCDLLLGPLASSYSQLAAPIVTIPMISEAATSTALSDKDRFPMFSRSTPDDGANGKAIARTMAAIGVKTTSMFCIDDTFGNSLANAVVTNFPGTVDLRVCVKNDATTEEITSALKLIKNSAQSSTIVLSVGPSDGFDVRLTEALVLSGIAGTFTMFLSDAMCSLLESLDESTYLGSFCILPTLAPLFDNYKTKYQAQDPAAVTALAEQVWDVFPIDPKFTIFFSSMAADAALLGLKALNRVYNENRTLFGSEAYGTELLKILRNTTAQGTSGTIVLDENGDRLSTLYEIQNVQPIRGLTMVGSVDESSTVTFDRTVMYIAKRGIIDFSPGSQLDFYIEAPKTVETEPPVFTILGILIGVTLFVLAIVAVIKVGVSGVKEVLTSEIWLTIGKIIAHFVDIASDVLGCYVVVQRDSPVAFSVMYVILTFFAFCVSLFELVRLMGYYIARVEARGKLTSDQTVSWEKKIAQTAVISLVVEDIPMVTMALAALSQESDAFLLFSSIFSSLLFGMKIGKVRYVVSTFMKGSHGNSMMQRSEKTVLDKAVNADDGNIDELSPPHVVKAFLAKLDKERLTKLRQHRLFTLTQLERAGVDAVEFHAFVYRQMIDSLHAKEE